MRNAVINFKTDRHTKKLASKKALMLGVSLSDLLNAYLKQLINSRSVTFSTEPQEPSAWLIEELRKAGENTRKIRNRKGLVK